MTGRSFADDEIRATHSSSPPQIHHGGRNVFPLLARREISPRSKCLLRWQWGDASKPDDEFSFGPCNELVKDARRGLFSWVEAESLRHLSAIYCPLLPPPRSTIAAAFSPDGKTLASTHGDHTVKIIDCQTGNCLKVLNGHRRTPWVVRFHPEHPEILASGSLDHEVRLWNAITSECIGSRDFYRPIASIAFHAEGEVLAVASGHKLYIWHYNRRGETSSPTIVLKTRRSLRAVHFHPHGAPFLLTAEVNDIDSSDSSMTRATSIGSLSYPPPAVYVANEHSSSHLSMAAELPLMFSPFAYFPSLAREDSRADLQLGIRPIGPSHTEERSSPSTQNALERFDLMEMSPIASNSHVAMEETETSRFHSGLGGSVGEPAMENVEVQSVGGNHRSLISGAGGVHWPIGFESDGAAMRYKRDQVLHSRDTTCWGLPFLQGWLMGQTRMGIPTGLPVDGERHEYPSSYLESDPAMMASELPRCNGMDPFITPSIVNRAVVSGGSAMRDHSSRTHLTSTSDSRQSAPPVSIPHVGSDSGPNISRIQSELAASLAATAAAELPCTVKLRIWPHDIRSPCNPLDAVRSRLTIPHAVLCSEMGAHFSPCGRFLAACVACVLPQTEADPGLFTHFHQEFSGAGTSPTRHPISACQFMFELRIYSLEEATFGSVLVSRPIRAAHCLTSIQFSPTSEHILLAYGRRHSSLLKSIVINGETSLPVYTVLEVYRVSNMQLVSVLPSSEDEVNVACFHPSAGGGLVYGTKEGKLRVLHYDGSYDKNCIGTNLFSQEDMVEVQTYALEC